ncbi:hypothetical protein BKA64DRAFT_562490 [Cadophora sp. MPI-SDFR-AT-0126]|nr:hypothetical protein BKA64DRAFT_562490 [Leotiomycetes sp. MPI-SDFR-AT-0126]
MPAPGENVPLGSAAVAWLKRDALLFAVSIGNGTDELNFVFVVLYVYRGVQRCWPFILTTAFKLTDQEVVDFSSRFTPPVIPSVPKLNPDNIIDGGRTMTSYRQIPTSSAGRRFELRSRLVGVYDKGKLGSIIEDEKILVDAASGEEYVKAVGNTFYLGQGN